MKRFALLFLTIVSTAAYPDYDYQPTMERNQQGDVRLCADEKSSLCVTVKSEREGKYFLLAEGGGPDSIKWEFFFSGKGLLLYFPLDHQIRQSDKK